jgi:hypothetical protein
MTNSTQGSVSSNLNLNIDYVLTIVQRNLFDISAPTLEAFPPKWAAGYLNTAETQQALGVPLNFTGNSAVIASGD